jgi:hypothetical protein
VAVPKQACGLTTFDKRLMAKCPPNPNAIRSIVFSRDNLAVVNGATTEIQISLLNFFVPVVDAARTSFTLPAKTPNVPLTIYKLDLAGLDTDEKVKFLGLLPNYGSTANNLISPICGGTAGMSTAEYTEWAFIKDIEVGELYNKPIIGPSGSSTLSFDISEINKLEFSWGGYVSSTGASGSLWIGTNGGLLNWNGIETKLWNTLNSNSPSDYIKTIAVDSSNSVWVGTNAGLSRFSTTEGFSTKWNLSNSNILSDNVSSLKLYSTKKIAVGTDNGLSLLNYDDNTWKNFNAFNTYELQYSNIASLATDSNYIFSGTLGGVYTYDFLLDKWNSAPFNTTTPGWTAPVSVTAIEAYGGNIYVGTTGGLVIVPYMGGTATTVLSGLTGPISNNYKSLRVVKYGTDQRLYASHDDGFSVYSITDDAWILTADSSSYAYLGTGINDLLPDSVLGSSNETVFFGSETVGEGVARIYFGPTGASGSIFSYIPESNKLTNLLLSFPLNPSCTPLAQPVGTPGQWEILLNNTTNVDTSQLYPNNQPLYFLFSKDMRGGTAGYVNFQDNVTVSSGLTGSASTVSGTWMADQAGKLFIFTPSTPLDKATPYNLSFSQGATAGDGSNVKEKINTGFYTEDIVPILGWNVLGKMLIHTGAESNLTQGLYLRNPQSTGVNFTTLIGK